MRTTAKQVTLKSKALVTTAVAAVLGLSATAYPLAAHAMDMSNAQATPTYQTGKHNGVRRYTADIEALNQTGVHGSATFKLSGQALTVSIHATGLQPGVHPQHIHGKANSKATCPTMSADTNGDGYVSVVEGAAAYGPIKVNLTNPQTPFGAPPTLALFTPFAGTANSANFPVVGQDGILNFSQTYVFDSSAAAQGAYESLLPLGDQHVVIHGAEAPKSVDADAFAALGAPYAASTDLTQPTYDALLPVACGTITPTSHKMPTKNGDSMNMPASDTTTTMPANSNQMDSMMASLATDQSQAMQGLMSTQAGSDSYNTQVNALSNTFESAIQTAATNYNQQLSNGSNHDDARNQLINAFSSAKDAELNGLTEARNQQVDSLNQAGNVSTRDAFLTSFDSAFNSYKDALEQVKNAL